MVDVDTTVLIVGGGPAGLTSAAALADYGIDHVLLEKYEGTAHTPRAHIVSQRTVEIMRHLGCEQDLLDVATPQEMMRNNLWVTSLAGREIARLEAWGTQAHRFAEYSTSSPSPMVNCPQTSFEPMLVEVCRRKGADLRFGEQFLGYEHDGDRFVSTVRNRRTGDTTTVRSKYVIGADGARTSVLGLAGLTIDGPSGLSHAVNIWFRADLTKYLAHRPGVLIWNLAPGPLPPLRLGTLICHKPFTEFVLVRLYDPASTDPASLDHDQARAFVEQAVGAPVPDMELLGVAGWQVNAQVAPKYSAGNVFCMGDAVHRHPPTNGLGLNMSVADAFNLAWKIALVERGCAGQGLLDTYSSERQPVGHAGVSRAIKSLGEAGKFESALGYTPGQSADDGWAELAKLDDPGPEGNAMRAALQEQLRIAHNQFNAHNFDLGYCYETGALVHDGSTYATNPGDPVLHFHATTRPGARVPHARLERDGRPLSTLDLVDGLSFGLIVGLDHRSWSEAAAQVSEQLGVEVVVHRVGGSGGILDAYGEWASVREVGDDGCVLVRPDRHVGWRSLGATEDPAAALGTAMRAILSR